MDNTQFRAAFPEFTDTVMYPDAMLDFWATLATAQVRECRWKTATNTGIQLYVAHEITLAAQNAKTAGFGGAPGTMGGVPNQKTVGAASVGYDSQVTSEKDAGYWNLTNYGKQFIRLARIFGAGPVQLNGAPLYGRGYIGFFE